MAEAPYCQQFGKFIYGEEWVKLDVYFEWLMPSCALKDQKRHLARLPGTVGCFLESVRDVNAQTTNKCFYHEKGKSLNFFAIVT